MRGCVCAVLALLIAAQSQAATLQTHLIRASNETSKSDPQIKDLEVALRKQFGYQHYQLLGVKSAALKISAPQRLELGEGFAMAVTPKGVDKKVHELAVEWISGKTSLVRSTVKIAQDSHLFIKGPEVGNDWIILALSVK